jgi:phosphatidate cytidylyltransferase
MSARGKFADLGTRTLSSAAMLVGGVVAVYLGGPVFDLMVAALCGAMVWELTRMLDPEVLPGKANATGFSAAVALYVFAHQLSDIWVVLAFVLATTLLTLRIPANRKIYAAYLMMTFFAAYGLIMLRVGFGAIWVLWLFGVVIVSDLAGYFAGRTFGGPKLWARVSPKKTWSGTVVGWGCAAIVGAAFMQFLGQGPMFIVVSIVISMAGQAGDIAESAIKRYSSVKDSSNLIPGHGGVMDRFDAMVGAALAFAILAYLGAFATSVGG